MTETDERVFGEQIADSVESFLLALRAIAREGNGSQAVSLLLLEISQVLLAGARMGAQNDFTPLSISFWRLAETAKRSLIAFLFDVAILADGCTSVQFVGAAG